MVDRCICLRKSFADIKKLADNKGYSTIAELQMDGICSTECKLCIPYVAEMLRTGKTEFIFGTVISTFEKK